MPISPRLSFTWLLVLLLWSGYMPSAQAETIVAIQTELARMATNDLASASLFVEASGNNLKTLSVQVNQKMAATLALVKKYPQVSSRTGTISTLPVYDNTGRNLKSWTLRSEILLESQDMEAFSGLLGQLQQSMAVGHMSFMPAPKTHQQVENQTIEEAIAAFKSRADLVARTLGKPYTIKRMEIRTHDMQRPLLFAESMRSGVQADKSLPLPIEAGESEIRVFVTGEISLGDRNTP